MPVSASVIAAWSTAVPRQTAATMPSGIDTAIATSIAAAASSKVAGSRSRIASVTGSLVRSDVPRSPARRPQEGAVLLEQRPIEAEARAQLGHVLGRGGLAEHRLRRVAGNEVDQREDERRDAEQHRDGQRQAAREKPEHALIVHQRGPPSVGGAPANSRRPSGSVMATVLAVGEPLRASQPSTVTSVPPARPPAPSAAVELVGRRRLERPVDDLAVRRPSRRCRSRRAGSTSASR